MDTGSGYSIIVETIHKPEYGCTGKYIFSQCSLGPSIASYRLHIKGNTTYYKRDKTLQEAYVTNILVDSARASWVLEEEKG